ncbi:TetR/AcrR family transcriptional regulator [Umezawaea tangerina]|uniref:TetR family transcriptional regulator n=1 Tax=Umezawaea tangerina TaxID=84725 RepID=A0A2T0STF4_9PSEU|nr:TetR/AcrR family transcriptional regulator [Umezawaea tangerina]PRY36689.1 TetR family transcriptional regulator [Umezawaea tangerina]
MPRWEPNALERLHTAAIELFAEQGYDATTAAGIAERAGLAKSTFFRHFPDKREVLFFGQEALNGLLAAVVADAPADATPLEAVGAALEATGVAFGPQRWEAVRRRQEIIDAHPELRERELLKREAMTGTMATALRGRGVPEPVASLAAQLGDLALARAYTRWLDPASTSAFGELTRQALDELRSAAAALG